ncbi:MAG: tol-pal system protein YbgF [Thiothrix sp.]|uniref:tol-pal system protein YbgF n=1 Tax=Thiothrix sp. TaxID=1032 RepID=UPI00262640A3|nr:tol-pal system protein YbgF [Thiothrix sp.]MDD5391897.1 tol-pal system protein YbgF [Thiothrix sp.]
MRNKDTHRTLALLVSALLSAPLIAAPLSDDAAVQLLQRLNDMEKEVSTLRGENEQLRNDLKKVQEKQSETLQQVDERMDKLKPDTTDTTGTATLDKPTSDTTSGTASDSTASNKLDSLPSGISADKPTSTDPNSYYSYGTGVPDDKNPPKSADSASGTSSTGSTTDKPADTTGSADKLASSSTSTDKASTDSTAGSKADDKPLPEKEERSVYDEAFNTLLKTPKDAIPAFRKFLKDYPSSSLASSAQYWIGEALYAEKDYKGASDEFLIVLKDYKGSDKAPGAALKLGYSFYELKEWDKARKTLEDVISFFPESTETKQKAQERLDKMKAEGH